MASTDYLTSVSTNSNRQPQNAVAFSVAGGTGNSTLFLVDGGYNNDSGNNTGNAMPFPDALQEFRTESGVRPARYGMYTGATVNAVTRSGAATVYALLASGAEVVAWDAREEARDAILPGTGRGTGEAGGGGAPQATSPAAPPFHQPAAGPPPRAGGELRITDLDSVDLTTIDALIVSPGVPLNRHPLVAKARAAGTAIIGDIELFAQARV